MTIAVLNYLPGDLASKIEGIFLILRGGTEGFPWVGLEEDELDPPPLDLEGLVMSAENLASSGDPGPEELPPLWDVCRGGEWLSCTWVSGFWTGLITLWKYLTN